MWNSLEWNKSTYIFIKIYVLKLETHMKAEINDLKCEKVVMLLFFLFNGFTCICESVIVFLSSIAKITEPKTDQQTFYHLYFHLERGESFLLPSKKTISLYKIKNISVIPRNVCPSTSAPLNSTI